MQAWNNIAIMISIGKGTLIRKGNCVQYCTGVTTLDISDIGGNGVITLVTLAGAFYLYDRPHTPSGSKTMKHIYFEEAVVVLGPVVLGQVFFCKLSAFVHVKSNILNA